MASKRAKRNIRGRLPVSKGNTVDKDINVYSKYEKLYGQYCAQQAYLDRIEEELKELTKTETEAREENDRLKTKLEKHLTTLQRYRVHILSLRREINGLTAGYHRLKENFCNVSELYDTLYDFVSSIDKSYWPSPDTTTRLSRDQMELIDVTMGDVLKDDMKEYISKKTAANDDMALVHALM